MEVVNDKAALLCNFEVLTFLQGLSTNEKGQKKIGQHQQLATIVYETTKYLEGTPCNLQSADVVKSFKAAVAPFSLTKFEKLQLLNQRPTTAAEIHPIIEECEERLTEEELSNLLEIIKDVLPTDEIEILNEAEDEEEPQQ